MSGHNIERLSEDIKREISAAIRVVNPSGIVSVTRCELTGDLSYCKVYVSSYEGGENTVKTAKELKNSAGFFKRQINSRIKMRKIPELIFLPDNSLDYYEKINGIINELSDAAAKGDGDEHYRNG
ncbi:MAG: 30S ribosome-binding factor RbfA [Oscillospiraceae bacterium]|jgi:ribosome-binding factor A|nr:30S ribosome-binding factor RbfA [Oscillospiraceae bacterium]